MNSPINPKRLVGKTDIFFRRIRGLIRHPVFHGLTVMGNFMMVLGAVTFYAVEKGKNPHVVTFLDAIWWAVSTVTTVGYGDVFPVTVAGRCLGIVMMIFGVALFSSFTALFASRLLAPELSEMEDKFEKVEREIESDEDRLERMIQSLETSLAEFKAAKSKGRT